ncbi:MAG: carbohydrate ABC transporter permease [Chloroflexota bacterium]|nr:carbohydrate ABC transporter permease [Chloroflexota bacterium]MDE2857417.1 carbohydrate ABC transporter permease [Chloroflexota bacterium]MDE2951172.1 carbohydrate ABC transporter permease [Chloroflexota bacterium]
MARKANSSSVTKPNKVNVLFLNSLVLIGIILTAVPFIYMVTASFRSQGELYSLPVTIMPREVVGQNYPKLFDDTHFILWYGNTIFTSSIRTALGVYFAALAGCAFAKYQFRFKRFFFFLVLATLTLPFHVLLIPLFIMMINFGWVGDYLAIIVPGIVGAFNIFLMRQYIESVPDELMDAARIDGASEFRIFHSVVIPLVRPALGVVAILTFVNTWNDFLWPLIVLNDPKKYLLTIGLATMDGPFDVEIGAIMAGSFLSTLPIIFIFVLMQRQIIAGLTQGAIRG